MPASPTGPQHGHSSCVDSRMSTQLRITALCAVLATACAAPAGTAVSLDVVRTFREARKAGDLETARSLMSADPRVWYGERSGEGSPWTLGGGRWKTWDEHFNSTSEELSVEAEENRVSIVFLENNDYYRLTERGPSPVRLTWFLDEGGQIEGYLVSSVKREGPSTSRYDEFEVWAQEHAPDEFEYLVPGGSIDPTGDRAPRFRALLEAWRKDAGLPAI